MQRIKLLTLPMFILAISAFTVLLPSSSQTYALTTCDNASHILTLPVWYQNLNPSASDCTVQIDQLSDIWIIAANVIEILLQLVAYITTAFIIYGGFRYLTSQGNQNAIGSAKTTITRAIIGLGIAIASVAIVHYVSASLGNAL